MFLKVIREGGRARVRKTLEGNRVERYEKEREQKKINREEK